MLERFVLDNNEEEKETTEAYTSETLIKLLSEARATEGEYLTAFELDYSFPTNFAFGAFNRLRELEVLHVLKEEDEETTTVTLSGQGAAQIESLVKFDAWFTLQRTLDVASGLRIDLIEMQEQHPFLFWLNSKMGRSYSIPTNKEVEAMVREEYRSYGIEF